MTHFPPFRFDSDDRTLWRGTTEVPLTPKASALLACLLEARGARVSKDTILATVWPDTHVQPDNVKVLIREIRHALGDSPIAPAYIRSIARGGYAFVAPIVDRTCPGNDWLLSPRAQTLVHRGPEIAALVTVLQALPSAAPRLALITGDHGGGKTTLCEGFLRAVRASSGGRVAYAQCCARELPQEPYYPILDALLRLDRQYPGLVPAVLAEHAPTWLALFPQWSGTPGRPSADARLAMLDELSAALSVMAYDGPLAIVIDDLQWADGDTLRALLQLGTSAASPRVMVVATCSEGVWTAGADAREGFAAAVPGMASIPLPPFTRRQVAEYAIARFGSGPLEALASIVHVVTGGNPLMVTAAFDSLVERRMVGEGPNGWRRESSIEAIGRALPDTLADVVSRQLEQLETHEREAIEAAAAVGVEFTLGAVAVALQWQPRAVAEILGPLARREQLIVADNAPGATWQTAEVYRFRHAFYADVIAHRAPRQRQRAFAERVSAFRERPGRIAT